jgi:transcriptional regulator with XRE-family HTH domain
MLQLFSSRIKLIRKTKKLSQKEISHELGVSDTTYQNYEYGKRIPPGDFLFNLANQYNVNPSLLLTGKGVMFEELEETADMMAERPGISNDDSAYDQALMIPDVQMLIEEIGKLPKDKQLEIAGQFLHTAHYWTEK